MKGVGEIRNFCKELIKGTVWEPSFRSLADLIKPRNRQDDLQIVQIMSRVLTNDSNCIDVGCNTGDFLQPILRLAPAGNHIAVEPIPRLAQRLSRRFPQVAVKELALSDSFGETTFWYVTNAPALSSLYKQVCEQRSGSEAIAEPLKVKTQKLDDLLPPSFRVDLIKVDVEGAELQVFQGAKHTLKTHQPYVVFEHGSDTTAPDNSKVHDWRIYDLLVTECGLQIYQLQNWLEGLPPLDRQQFAKSRAWNFLAAPR